jgi:hypothetical protein
VHLLPASWRCPSGERYEGGEHQHAPPAHLLYDYLETDAEGMLVLIPIGAQQFEAPYL